MRAVICNELGSLDALSVEDVDPPKADKGQVVIDVKASSLNFPDVLLLQGKYQFQPTVPFSPGGEVAGVVSAVGAGVDDIEVGQHCVTAMPWGGWREQLAVDASRILKLPASIDFDVAASFLQAYGTSHYALTDRGQLREGDSLVVLGAAGGCGLAAVELGKLMGAKVIACASSDEKLALCKEKGADATINYQNEDLKKRIKALTSGGADVLFDVVGGDYSEPALRAMAWNGRFLVLGFAGNEIPKIPLNLVLLKSCQIVGVFWGQFTMREPEKNFANVRTLIGWIEEGKIKPHVSKRYTFDEASVALRDMMERRVRGKVVIVP